MLCRVGARFVRVMGQETRCVAGFSGAWHRRHGAAGTSDHEWGERGQVSRRSGYLTIRESRVARRSCIRAHREFIGGCTTEAIKPSVFVFGIEPGNENISQDTGAHGSAAFIVRKSTVHLLPRVWA
jgi:hypothetical protein